MFNIIVFKVKYLGVFLLSLVCFSMRESLSPLTFFFSLCVQITRGYIFFLAPILIANHSRWNKGP